MGYELRSYAWRALAFFVVLELLLVAAILWWPQFAANIDSIRNMAAPIPVLAGMVDQLQQGGVSAYVLGQHFFKGCNTLGAAAAVLLAMGAIAGEAHRGTLELWLARPISRRRLLTERFLLGWLALAVPIFLSSSTIPALLAIHEESMPWRSLWLCSLHETVFLGALYSLTFLLSTLAEQPTKIAFAMLFFSIFQFAVYMVKTVTHWSLFRLADIEVFLKIAARDSLDVGRLGALLAICLASYVAACLAFARRAP